MAAGGQHNNGNGHATQQKPDSYRIYEHGVAIADLARRTSALEDDARENKIWRDAMMKAHLATDKKLDRLLNRAWGVGKTMAVGAAVFVSAMGAAAWLADKVGMTIHFGG